MSFSSQPFKYFTLLSFCLHAFWGEVRYNISAPLQVKFCFPLISSRFFFLDLSFFAGWIWYASVWFCFAFFIILLDFSGLPRSVFWHLILIGGHFQSLWFQIFPSFPFSLLLESPSGVCYTLCSCPIALGYSFLFHFFQSDFLLSSALKVSFDIASNSDSFLNCASSTNELVKKSILHFIYSVSDL